MKFRFCILFLLLSTIASAQLPANINTLITAGEFTRAQQEMRMLLANDPDLPYGTIDAMRFEVQRLERIKKDFTKTRQDVIAYIQNYIPDVTDADISRWESARSLEYQIIDGDKRYFNRAGPNLFRIDKEARQMKMKKDASNIIIPGSYSRLTDVTSVVQSVDEENRNFVDPQRFRIEYTLSVDANAAPPGEIIRCWLPYPREITSRQTDVQLIGSEPKRHIIAANDTELQRSIYLEKPAIADEKTVFQAVYEYTAHAVYQPIDPDEVRVSPDSPGLSRYTEERPPHIVFSPELRALSKKIVGNEKNPYKIARKLFQWIDANIPWASAREYSTFRNISHYVYENRHADCGMQTIFFITLCRMNGIPARWQSGWVTTPGDDGMHDWGEIYFEPYGWVPMDVTYGLNASREDEIKWFYLSGMDKYRLIVNDDYSRPLYPAKMHLRSETIDFQRGEVEWSGGNLYFDQWDYRFDVTILYP
jgi:transglutaminase-like putative cysteine protease